MRIPRRMGPILSSRRSLLLILIIGAVICLAASTARAACPALSPGYCSTSGQCNGGTCERGVCRNCPVGKIGENCQANDVLQKLGNVVITQAGLDFAPIEYFQPINEAYEEAKATSLVAASYNGACVAQDGDNSKSYRVSIAALQASQFTRSNLLQNSIKFQITSNGIRASATADYAISKARLDFWGGANCCPCTGDCTKFTCPRVCSKSDPGDWIDFEFKATMTADIVLAYSAAVNGLTATVTNAVISFDDDSLGANLNCPTQPYNVISNMVKTYFEQLKSEIGPTLEPSLKTAITNSANRVIARYQGAQALSARPGVTMIYTVTGLAIHANSYIALNLEGKIMYTHFYNNSGPNCWINTTYADTSTDASLTTPTEWRPITKNLSPSGLYSPILAGTRLTRSAFNGLVWASFQDPAQRERQFVATFPQDLAAHSQVSFSVPYFRIPNDASEGRLRVSVNGAASLSCPPQSVTPVLGLNFQNLDASFKLRYDNTPPDPSIAFQVLPNRFTVGNVLNVATQAPSINNANLLKSAMEGALNFQAPALDAFLLQKGNGVLTLPPDLKTSFPDAVLRIVSQGGAGGVAIPNESGYIEMINRCACSSSSTPLQNQGEDGTVNICPRTFLTRNYCMFSSFDGQTPAGRRLEESAENRNEENQAHLRNSEQEAMESASQAGRSLSTPQQEADLTTVLGALVNICVTKQPTSVPTTAAPTLKPTMRPTRSPTTFEGLAGTRDVCVNGANGCLYQRDVLFFVCKDGYEEVTECRYQNSDMYCCPKKSASSQNGVLHDFAWIASVLALALSLILA